MAANANTSTDAGHLLIPLTRQPIRDLIVLLWLVAVGLPLRRGLRVPGQGDAEAIRAELRRREWAVDR